jgi:creatinine amidohydrolase
MRLEDTNWMEVERYLETDDRIILITGSTEQHAYLSLLTDILIPSKIALAVAEREKVLIAPPLNFGVSELFVDFPGTISLSQGTFEMVLGEIVEGLLHHGFRRFFVMNGHGGNNKPSQLDDLEMEGLVRIEWYNWWQEDAVHEFENRHNLMLNHANWGENFPFNRVAESPAEEKTSIDRDDLYNTKNPRELLGDGNFGGLYQVADVLMSELFALVVDEATSRLRAMPPIR